MPVGSRDPQTVICLSEGFPGQAWIDDQIDASVNYLAAHWQGPWNHGLVQDLKLMRIGCAYPAAAFGGDALRWRQTADSQILSSFGPGRLGPSIDTQGAVNEQATGYERFLWRRDRLRVLVYRREVVHRGQGRVEDKGTCTLSATKLKTGSYRLVADYAGNSDFNGSASATKTVTVVK